MAPDRDTVSDAPERTDDNRLTTRHATLPGRLITDDREIGQIKPFLARRRMRACARRALDDLGVRIRSVDSPVGSLSGGQRQAVAVARSVRAGAQILLLDEPIAAMGTREGMAILDLIARLREQTSLSMILVAHNYAHVRMVCDRVNLLEDGRIVLDQPVSQTSIEELTDWMTASLRRLSHDRPRRR